MPPVIILDTGPLSNSVVPLARPRQTPTVSQECRSWLRDCEIAGVTIIVPARDRTPSRGFAVNSPKSIHIPVTGAVCPVDHGSFRSGGTIVGTGAKFGQSDGI